MITTAPLPEWRDLAILRKPAPPAWDDDALAAPWRGDGAGTLWLSRSAWSLHVIARWWQSAHRGRVPVVWVPDYFCNQSLEPLRRCGAQLVFYPVARTLRPDWEACEAEARRRPPDLMVIVHVFGTCNDLAGAAAFRRRHGGLLIEDAAHVLRPVGDIGLVGDLVLYSPHKLMPIPDGALIVTRTAIVTGGLLAALDALGGGAPDHRPWVTRRLVQKVLPAAAWRLRRRRKVPFEVDPPAGPLPQTPVMSEAARRMLGEMLGRLGGMARQRRAIDMAVREIMAAPHWQPLCEEWGDGAPYRTVMRCAEPAVAAECFRRLRAGGFLVEGWPDLPPEVLANPRRHHTAITLRRTLLLLPLAPDSPSAAPKARQRCPG